MQLVPEETAVAVVGIWNPAILTPEWLLRHAFPEPGGPDEDVRIEFDPGNAFGTRFTIRAITFWPSPRRLIVRHTQQGVVELDAVEDCIRRILTELPHTPLQAFGHNFSFIEPQPTENQLAVFSGIRDLERLTFAYRTSRAEVVSTVLFEDRTLNLTRRWDETALRLAFNFDYQVPNSNEALQRMQPGSLSRNFRYAYQIAAELYGADNPFNEEHAHGQEAVV